MPPPPLELEQLIGLNHETSSSVHFLSATEIVYPVETYVVVMNCASRSQKFFREHTHTVTTVAVHSGKKLCVSGQKRSPASKVADVFVWSFGRMAVHRRLSYHQGDMLAVAFSVCGSRVFTLGRDSNRSQVAVWDIAASQAKRVVTAALQGEVIHAVVPGPVDLPDAFEWVSYGVGQVKFWSLSKYQPTFTHKKGTFGPGCPSGTVPTVTAVTWATTGLVVGTDDGRIYFFDGYRGGKCIRGERGAVVFLAPWKNRLVAVNASGSVALIADHKTTTVPLLSAAGAPDGRLQFPLTGGTATKTALVVYSASHIVHADLGALDRVRVLMETAGKPLTCLAALDDCMAVGSFDGCLRLYRPDQTKAVKTHRASSGVTTCAISAPFDEDPEFAFRLLACGRVDGVLQVLNDRDMRVIYERQVSQTKVPLLCSAFSPVASDQPLWLAIGGQDATVYCTIFPRTFTEDLSGVHLERRSDGEMAVKGPVFRGESQSEVKGPVFRGHGGHCSPVVALQFSSTTPPQVLASVGLDGQIVCFDLAGGRRLPSARYLLELPFDPYQLPVGPPLEGLWQEELGSTSKPGEEIEKVRNTGASVSGSGVAPTRLPERYVAQAPGRRLLAVSSPEQNKIRLAELPLSAEGVHHRAHGARITGLAWCGAETLVSITSSRSIARWRVPAQPHKKAGFAPPSRVAASANSTRTVSSPDVAPSVEKENNQGFNGTATVDKSFFDKLGVGKRDDLSVSEPEEDMRSTQPLSVGGARVPEPYEDLQSTQPFQASGPRDLPPPWAKEARASGRRDLPPPWAVDDDAAAGAALGASRRSEPMSLANTARLEPEMNNVSAALHDWTQPAPVDDLDGFAGRGERVFQMESKRKTRDYVSPKIGSKVFAQSEQDLYDAHQAAASQGIAITERAKRSSGVHECMTSGPELQRTGRSIASDAQLRTKFKHNTAVTGMNFDIEVKLPGGTLSLVRADLTQQVVTFDGLVDGQSERLVVRVPAGYDLGSQLRTVKRFEEGYIRILVPRDSIHKTSREGILRI
jgi:WD40 repeat protein